MTKFYYFSGTGNTLWSAKKMAQAIGGGCELHSIGVEARFDRITVEGDAAVLLFPSYAYGAPVIVRRFVKKAVFNTPYVAFFATFGTRPGGTLAEVARILKRRHTGGIYCGEIPAVENYIAIFGAPSAGNVSKRLAMQQEATEAAARAVMARQTNRVNTFRPFSAFVSLLFSLGVKVFYKWYTVAGCCNGCGVCEKVCPVAAIAMRGSRPVFSGNCEHCQACLNWCPQRAIRFARLKPDTPRYHHPEITLAEIAR